MILQYSDSNLATTVLEIEDKLKALSLAFQKKQVTNNQSVTLIDGKTSIKGKTAILEHLRLLEGELNAWYYCDC